MRHLVVTDGHDCHLGAAAEFTRELGDAQRHGGGDEGEEDEEEKLWELLRGVCGEQRGRRCCLGCRCAVRSAVFCVEKQ